MIKLRMVAGVLGGVMAVMAMAGAGPATRPAVTQTRGELLMRERTALMVLTGQGTGVICVAYSGDGKLLASGGGDGSLVLWDAVTGKQVRRMQLTKGAVFSLAWSPDDKWVVTGDTAHGITVWDAASGEIVDRHEQRCPVGGVVFLSDGQHVVSECGEDLRWWKVGEDAEVMHQTVWQGYEAKGLLVLEGDKLAAFNKQGHAVVLDGETGATVAEYVPKAGDENVVVGIARLRGTRMLLSSRHETVAWDWKSDERTVLAERGWPRVAVTKDEGLLMGDGDGLMVTWDVKGKTDGATFGFTDKLNAVAISPGEERVALAEGGTWDGHGWAAQNKSQVVIYDLQAARDYYSAYEESTKSHTGLK